MHGLRKKISLFVILAMLAVGIGGCTEYQYQGATTGMALGGLAGALLDHENPWRGGLIGAALGGTFGATLADISARGRWEAARHGKPVEYRTTDGRGIYRAEPLSYDEVTKCRKIHERIWENGVIVKDQIREVCESERYGRTYEPRDFSPPPPGAYYEPTGPPPWEPAYGYTQSYTYRYYPDSYIYYYPSTRFYFYLSGGNRWIRTRYLPRHKYVNDLDYVIIKSKRRSPWRQYHRDVTKRYPPGYHKKKFRRGDRDRDRDRDRRRGDRDRDRDRDRRR